MMTKRDLVLKVLRDDPSFLDLPADAIRHELKTKHKVDVSTNYVYELRDKVRRERKAAQAEAAPDLRPRAPVESPAANGTSPAIPLLPVGAPQANGQPERAAETDDVATKAHIDNVFWAVDTLLELSRRLGGLPSVVHLIQRLRRLLEE